MTERERFRETLLFGKPDRVPLKPGGPPPGGPRESTLAAWHRQGLPEGVDWYDYLMDVLSIQREPTQTRTDLGISFNMQPAFEEKVLEHRDGHTIVQDWMGAVVEIPDKYDSSYLRTPKDFHSQVASLSGAEPPGLGRQDQVALHSTPSGPLPRWLVAEDMAYKLHSMISPTMTRHFLLPTWKKWAETIKASGCPIVCMHCDGYMAELMPIWIEAGFNCCYPVEVAAGNDIVAFRRQYGAQMTYIGGIDKRALTASGETMRAKVTRVVPPLLEEGGFIPACDHGVPPDVSWPNFGVHPSPRSTDGLAVAR